MKVEGLPALKKQLGVFALKAGGGAEVGPESPFSLVVITFPFYLHFVGPLRAEENLSGRIHLSKRLLFQDLPDLH